MSILHPSTLLHGAFDLNSDSDALTFRRTQQQSQFRAKSSFASLVHFVRNPFENVGETVEHWRDGLTKEERARKQSLEDKKQLLYLRLRVVRSLECPLLQLYILTKIVGKELRRLATSCDVPRRD